MLKLRTLSLVGAIAISILPRCHFFVKSAETPESFKKDVVTKRVTFKASAGEFRNIFIKAPIGKDKVSVKLADTNDLRIEGDVAADSEETIEHFQAATTDTTDGGNLIVEVDASFPCKKIVDEADGKTKVRGACILGLQIFHPPGTQTKIYLNDVELNIAVPTTPEELKQALTMIESHDERKVVIKNFIKARKKDYITVAQLVDIIRDLGPDREKLDYVRLFSGRIDDPKNAEDIAEAFSSQKAKLAAVNALQE